MLFFSSFSLHFLPYPPPNLSLDPNDDPLCVLLMIDVYALRAQDEKFLLRLASEWEVQNRQEKINIFN